MSDPDSQPVRMEVEYQRVGATTWQTAQPSSASDNMGLLPAPAIEADYRFMWNAAADLPNQSGSVTLRFRPFKGNVAGTPADTGAFRFDTRNTPVPAPYVPPPPPLYRRFAS